MVRGQWGDRRWFVALMEDGRPVEVLDFATWREIATDERAENGHLVIAKDHIDAYLKATRGEFEG